LLLSKMRAVVLLAAIGLAAAIAPFNYRARWEDFKATHGKTYETPAEDTKRFGVFTDNLERIQELNKQYAPRTKFGVNSLADLTQAEFEKYYLSPMPAGAIEHIKQTTPVAPLATAEELQALPASWDWRPKGAVTGVKNQGQCGSCWSFSAVANMEGQWFLANNTLTGLSEQNLVDCDKHCMNYENQNVCDQGCDGGLMPNAFMYVIGNGGIDTEASYQYTAEDGTCSFAPSNVGAKFRNWTMVDGSEDQMAAYLVANGPLSVAVDAQMWQFYLEGVWYLPCGESLDHGVTVVGYGTETDILDQQMPYWIIKNSWGGSWGEEGYIRIEKGDGRCGVNLFPCSSII